MKTQLCRRPQNRGTPSIDRIAIHERHQHLTKLMFLFHVPRIGAAALVCQILIASFHQTKQFRFPAIPRQPVADQQIIKYYDVTW